MQVDDETTAYQLHALLYSIMAFAIPEDSAMVSHSVGMDIPRQFLLPTNKGN